MSAPTDWRKPWGKDKQVGEVDNTGEWRHHHCITISLVKLHHQTRRGRAAPGSRLQCSVLSVDCLSIDQLSVRCLLARPLTYFTIITA